MNKFILEISIFCYFVKMLFENEILCQNPHGDHFNLFLAIVLHLVQIFNKYLTNLRENLYITISESKEHFLLRRYDMLLHDIKK